MRTIADTDAGPLILLCVVMLVSAFLQTVSGFGFALVSAPAGAAILGVPETVATIFVVGSSVDLIIVAMRRSRPKPQWREVSLLWSTSLPGLTLGAVLLAVLPDRVLILIVAAAVTVAVARPARLLPG